MKGYGPVHEILVDETYVQIGVGRDYRDVPPTRGLFRGAATETIDVAVRTELAG